jgi:hypothetical protein
VSSPIRHRWIRPALPILALAAVAAGCGRDPAARLPVYGDVSCADGQTFNGSISFVPVAGSRGPAATTGIGNGYYCFDSADGPMAGPHRVLIRKILPAGWALKSLHKNNKNNPAAAPAASDAGGGKTTWTFSADVRLDGPYRHNFKLDR